MPFPQSINCHKRLAVHTTYVFRAVNSRARVITAMKLSRPKPSALCKGIDVVEQTYVLPRNFAPNGYCEVIRSVYCDVIGRPTMATKQICSFPQPYEPRFIRDILTEGSGLRPYVHRTPTVFDQQPDGHHRKLCQAKRLRHHQNLL